MSVSEAADAVILVRLASSVRIQDVEHTHTHVVAFERRKEQQVTQFPDSESHTNTGDLRHAAGGFLPICLVSCDNYN